MDVYEVEIKQLVDPNAELEKLSDGYVFTEGPVWDFSHSHLTFVDLAGDAMYRWDEQNGAREYRKPSNFANGLALDNRGTLLSCEHRGRRITREVDGGLETVVESFQGKKLNAPNDLVVARDGSIIFTDPHYGLMEGYGGPAEQELPFRGVYRVPAGSSEPKLLVDDFEAPNGLALTQDEKTLYVVDTERSHVRAFQVSDGWALSGGDLFVEVKGDGEGVPDGMKLDTNGNVYCTGPGGILVFDATGTALGRITLDEVAANLTWGDEDARTLYITASTALYRLRCGATGHVSHRR